MLTLPPRQQIIGDDWDITFVLRDAYGVPVDLTGATPGGELFLAFSDAPLGLTVANGRIVVPGAAGAVRILVERAVTSTVKPPQNAAAKAFPNRIQLFVDDVNGRRHTYLVLPIAPLSPNDPSCVGLPCDAIHVFDGGIQVPGPAGAAGAAGLVATAGPPSAAIGSADGQYAVDPSTGFVYGPRANGAWPVVPAFEFTPFAVGDLLTVL